MGHPLLRHIDPALRLLSKLATLRSLSSPTRAAMSYPYTFHKVGENWKTDGYVTTPNTMGLLANHCKEVDGKVSGVDATLNSSIAKMSSMCALGPNSIPARAKWDPPHRSRQSHQHQLRLRQVPGWEVHSPLRRHQSGEGGREVLSGD
jgi:hypothetical protein